MKLARDAIKEYLFNKKEISVDEKKIAKKLKEKRGVFVTLTIDGELRGCIGSLTAEDKLYLSVIKNAISAAFSDPRFNSLEKSELDDINIEISVLSPMKRLDYKKADELVKYLEKNKCGVYIRKGSYSATYLPQVWEHFNNTSDFLSSLCEKAWIDAGEWQAGDLEIFTYTVENFEEK